MGVLDLFLDLTALPTPPGEERTVADRVTAELRGLGLEVDEDGAGVEIGSNAGNLYAGSEPTAAGTPLFLCSHMDTVPPTGPIEPVVEDGVVRNARRHDPRRGQQVRGRGDGRDRPAGGRGAGPARGPRAPVHAEGGGRPARRPGVRLLAVRRPGGLRLRPGRADRRGDPRRAELDDHGDHLRRPVRARRHGAGGGALCDRGRRPRDRGHEARTSRRGDLGQRRRHPGRCRPQHRPRPLRPELRGAVPRRARSSRTSYRRCSTPARSPPPWPDARWRPR